MFDTAGTFVGYCGIGSDVTEKRRSEERLAHLALHDALTDLPNRVLFQQGLLQSQKRIASNHSLAILSLDIDGFKSVNDTFGHAAGDLLLQAVANRLRNFEDNYAMAARLAGDEFGILMEGPDGALPVQIDRLAEAIIASLSEPFILDDIHISIGVSIGVAMAHAPEGGELMHRADLALSRMKSEGRNGYRMLEAVMDERLEARRALKADLRKAMERNEFRLKFQPLVGAADGNPQGFEALLRWRHPVRGWVGPNEFIPIAEETGAIIPLGEWILREACRVAATWPSHLSVAVNLSPIQLRHSDLPAVVGKILEETGFPAKRLELEIVESVFLDATPAVQASLQRLRRLGVRL